MSASTIDTTTLPSEAFGLGNAIAEFKPSAAKPWVWVVLLFLMSAGACGLGGLSFADGEGDAAIVILIGVALLVLSAIVAITTVLRMDMRVVVLEKGLVYVKNKSSAQAIRWDDVTQVFQSIVVHYTNGIKTGTTHSYTLFVQGRQKISFNDTFKNVEALGNMIQGEVSVRLMPRIAEAYNAGGPVTFGRLTISKSGISNGKETLPWAQVQQVSINNGQISVRKQGKWLNWAGQSAAATPNLRVFLSIVDQIVGINQKR